MRNGRLAALLTGTLVLAGCDGGTGADSQERVDRRFVSTVAEAKQTPWPGGDSVDPELLDSRMDRDNFMVVLDMSGSMTSPNCAGSYDSKAEAAEVAITNWMQSVAPEANLGLIIFDTEGTSVRVPLGQDNRDAFKRHIAGSSASGGTPLQTAVALAHEELTRRARYQQGYGTYRLVVITDGDHSQGEDPTSEVTRIAGNPANPIEIHTIGFCIEDSALNQPGITLYHSAQNPKELARGLDSVLPESKDFATIQEFTGDDL